MTQSPSAKAVVSDHDRDLLDKLYDVINGGERPVLLGREGAHVQFPEPVFHVLVEAVRRMRRGQAVVVLPENEELTTQAAADQLGVSRPHLVKLLESDEILFHLVGTHRRVYLRDLLEYAKRRDSERSRRLSALSRKIHDEGYDDSSYTGDE